ncbi:MAG: hypothetical protein NZ927_06780 [Candidatus Calescibacterium sp.]|nr:hypothetical protein [Candidatus Calescibacterium sp.]MCX7734549.1 hypothetical protein [bacterium]MDW8087627.1 hypothetical protein [Candidatus Calescibacterium sp.]
MFRETQYRIPILLIILSFIIWISFLVALALKQKDINGIESTDSYFYLKLAENTYEGKNYTHKVYSPGYSWIVSVLLYFGVDLELAGRIVSATFSILSLIFAFLSFRTIGNDVAFFGSLSIAFLPQYIYYSTSTLPYSTATFFLWSVFYIAIVSRKSRIILPTIAGLLCGYGYIVRPENILGAILFLLITRNIISFLFFVAGFFLSSLPYHILSAQEGNLPSIISKFILYKVPGVGISTQDIEEQTEKIAEQAFSIKNHIRYFLSNIHLSHKYAIPNLVAPISLIIFGIGLGEILRNWRELKNKISPFLFFFLVWIIPIFSLIIVADYILIPILITFGAVCGNFFKHIGRLKTFFLVFIMLSLNIFWSARPFYSDDGRKIYKIAGEWIRQNLGENKTIFENTPITSFYANGIWTISPAKSEVCVLTSSDYFSPRTRSLIPLFISEENEDFKLAQKLKYKNIEAKIFIRKKENQKNQELSDPK